MSGRLSPRAADERRRNGVYYTPRAAARAQLRLVWDALSTHCDLANGLADQAVLVVDPAVGRGAYPVALAEECAARGKDVAALGKRLVLFETARAASRVAETRLATLGVEGAVVQVGDALARRPRLDAPIVACIGNPPYRRYADAPSGREGTRELVVPGAGVHAKNLYNSYVYFWRWALRVVCEDRRGPGVVSFLTPSAYLNGPAYGGLRQAVLSAFDSLWIVDLEGDGRGSRPTANVFEVRTPVAISIGLRRGRCSTSGCATVHYARISGTRTEKLARLASVLGLADLDWRVVEDASSFAPRSRSAYWSWPSLTDIFPWQVGGCQVKRTWPIAPEREVLVARWQALLAQAPSVREAWFVPTRDRTTRSRVKRLDGEVLEVIEDLEAGAACVEPVPYAYRAFDRQWLLLDGRVADFPRPKLWRSLGPRQVFLTSLLTHPLGPGPAAIATALVPDLDHFRGSFGGRAVMPLWLDADATRPNISQAWLDVMPPDDALAYVYALLANPTYVERFTEELRLGCARVPLVADERLRERAIALGRALLGVHTFASTPTGRARCVGPVEGALPERVDLQPGLASLSIGQVSIAPVAPEVWAYSVSGLRVLASWLGYRLRRKKGRASSPLDAIRPDGWSAGMTDELLRVIWTLEASIRFRPALDDVLVEVLQARLLSVRAPQ